MGAWDAIKSMRVLAAFEPLSKLEQRPMANEYLPPEPYKYVEPVETSEQAIKRALCRMPDFADSKAPVQKQRAMGSDCQAGYLASYMLSGRLISIAKAHDLLAESGQRSNDAGRRLREARSWLEGQGLSIVQKDFSGPDGTWKEWRVFRDHDLQLAAQNMLRANSINKRKA